MTLDPDAYVQDADIEMAELAALADEQDRCPHSYRHVEHGCDVCSDCGKVLT